MLIREDAGAAHSTGTQIMSTKALLNSRCKQNVCEMLGQLKTCGSFIHTHTYAHHHYQNPRRREG